MLPPLATRRRSCTRQAAMTVSCDEAMNTEKYGWLQLQLIGFHFPACFFFVQFSLLAPAAWVCIAAFKWASQYTNLAGSPVFSCGFNGGGALALVYFRSHSHSHCFAISVANANHAHGSARWSLGSGDSIFCEGNSWGNFKCCISNFGPRDRELPRHQPPAPLGHRALRGCQNDQRRVHPSPEPRAATPGPPCACRPP